MLKQPGEKECIAEVTWGSKDSMRGLHINLSFSEPLPHGIVLMTPQEARDLAAKLTTQADFAEASLTS